MEVADFSMIDLPQPSASVGKIIYRIIYIIYFTACTTHSLLSPPLPPRGEFENARWGDVTRRCYKCEHDA
jgi:hypothetical protein